MNLTEYAANLVREFESRVLSSSPPADNPHRDAQKYYFPCCNTVGISWHRHDYRHCECGKSMIDGGSSYIRCTPGVIQINKCPCGLMPWMQNISSKSEFLISCPAKNCDYGFSICQFKAKDAIEKWNSSVDSTP